MTLFVVYEGIMDRTGQKVIRKRINWLPIILLEVLLLFSALAAAGLVGYLIRSSGGSATNGEQPMASSLIPASADSADFPCLLQPISFPLDYPQSRIGWISGRPVELRYAHDKTEPTSVSSCDKIFIKFTNWSEKTITRIIIMGELRDSEERVVGTFGFGYAGNLVHGENWRGVSYIGVTPKQDWTQFKPPFIPIFRIEEIEF